MNFGEHLDILSLLFFESRTTSSLTNNPPHTQAERACFQNANLHLIKVGDKDVECRWFQKLLLGNPEGR